MDIESVMSKSLCVAFQDRWGDVWRAPNHVQTGRVADKQVILALPAFTLYLMLFMISHIRIFGIYEQGSVPMGSDM
jgi:hypothetical protein